MSTMSITPGPNNITMLYLGSQYGLKGTRKFLTASVISLFVKTLLCGLLGVFISGLAPALVRWLKWVGAAYMIYLATVMAMSGWKEEKATDEKKEGGSTYRDGIILQLLNVKSWIASLSIFATYVLPFSNNFLIILGVTLAFTALVIISSLIWGLFGSIVQRFIGKYKKPFGIAMGISLYCCAISAII